MRRRIERPAPEALGVVERARRFAADEGRAPRVLFVCLGNICRSPAAQGIMEKIAAAKGLAVECDSAGFYGGHAGDLPDRRMRETAWQRGYRLEHRARRIRLGDLGDFDIVVGMDDSNIDSLHSLADTDVRESKIVRMTDFAVAHPDADSVPDPYYGGAAGFQFVLDLLEDACSELVDELLKTDND